MLLVEYLYNEDVKRLFHGKPHIEFYLNAGDRKNYNNYMHKGKPTVNKNFGQVYLGAPNTVFGQPGQFFAPFPPAQGFAPNQNFVPGQGMMPPAFIPRPNFPNSSGK